jgi:hypothetical protein
MSQSDVVELVPRRAIGELRLGSKASELPSRAHIDPPAGELDGIRFMLDANQQVVDIWIDDLRTFKNTVHFQGKPIPHNASITELETLLGTCTQLAGVKGGIFYNCASGVALGTDFARKTLQLRVKHR